MGFNTKSWSSVLDDFGYPYLRKLHILFFFAFPTFLVDVVCVFLEVALVIAMDFKPCPPRDSGDSHEEVADLLYLPGQSTCGEHPGL